MSTQQNNMNLEVNDKGIIELREVFGGISLITKDGEHISIAMRDSGFELTYMGTYYEAKDGVIEEFIPLEKLHPESSQVARTKYYPEKKIMEVEFKSNGSIYHYMNVEKSFWKKALKADSIGSFVIREVKGVFEFTKIETPKKTDGIASVPHENLDL